MTREAVRGQPRRQEGKELPRRWIVGFCRKEGKPWRHRMGGLMKKFVGWKFPSLPGRSGAGELSSALRRLAVQSLKRRVAELRDDRRSTPSDVKERKRRRGVGVS